MHEARERPRGKPLRDRPNCFQLQYMQVEWELEDCSSVLHPIMTSRGAKASRSNTDVEFEERALLEQTKMKEKEASYR